MGLPILGRECWIDAYIRRRLPPLFDTLGLSIEVRDRGWGSPASRSFENEMLIHMDKVLPTLEQIFLGYWLPMWTIQTSPVHSQARPRPCSCHWQHHQVPVQWFTSLVAQVYLGMGYRAVWQWKGKRLACICYYRIILDNLHSRSVRQRRVVALQFASTARCIQPNATGRPLTLQNPHDYTCPRIWIIRNYTVQEAEQQEARRLYAEDCHETHTLPNTCVNQRLRIR